MHITGLFPAHFQSVSDSGEYQGTYKDNIDPGKFLFRNLSDFIMVFVVVIF